MTTVIWGLLGILLVTFISVLGMIMVRRIAEKNKFEKFHSVTDPTLNVVATLFSILLGFLVAGAMDDYQEARQTVEMEANSLANIYCMANGLPAATRDALRLACKEYAQAVIDEEWPAMGKRQTAERVWQASRLIWDEVLAYEPKSERQINVHESLLNTTEELAENRRTRIVMMRGTFSPALWLVVIGGSLIIIGCFYLFLIHATFVQAIMTSFVTLSLCLNIFLLVVYSNPFKGDLKIGPEAFVLDARIFAVHDPPPPKLVEGNDSKAADDDK